MDKIEYGQTYIIGGTPRVISSEEEYHKIMNKEKQKTMSLLMMQLYQPGDVEIKIPKILMGVESIKKEKEKGKRKKENGKSKSVVF